MSFSIVIPPPNKTKYMLLRHCCMCFCFVTFSEYIDIEKNCIDKQTIKSYN